MIMKVCCWSKFVVRSLGIQWICLQCWNWVSSDEIQTQNLRTPSYTVIAVDESESSLTIPYSEKYCLWFRVYSLVMMK